MMRIVLPSLALFVAATAASCDAPAQPSTPTPPAPGPTDAGVAVPRDEAGLPLFDPQSFCAQGERTASEWATVYAATTCACPTRACIRDLQSPFLMGSCFSYDVARDDETYTREVHRAIACLDALPES